MRTMVKLIGIIAIVAIIGFSFTACDDGSGTTTTTTFTVTVNGGSGSGSYAAGANVTITATVPSGQQFTNWTVNLGGVTLANANSASTSFTMPANAVTVTANFTGGGGSYSLDGAWQRSDGLIVTINGNNGVYTQIGSGSSSAIVIEQSALSQGYTHIGDQKLRNLTKTGDRTWTGQNRLIQFSSSAPNVATGTTWSDITITMNADGQIFQSFTPGSSTPDFT